MLNGEGKKRLHVYMHIYKLKIFLLNSNYHLVKKKKKKTIWAFK